LEEKTREKDDTTNPTLWPHCGDTKKKREERVGAKSSPLQKYKLERLREHLLTSIKLEKWGGEK